jgi:hypothetical protein
MGDKGDVFFLSLLEQLYPLKPEIILREREKMDLVELLLEQLQQFVIPPPHLSFFGKLRKKHSPIICHLSSPSLPNLHNFFHRAHICALMTRAHPVAKRAAAFFLRA